MVQVVSFSSQSKCLSVSNYVTQSFFKLVFGLSPISLNMHKGEKFGTRFLTTKVTLELFEIESPVSDSKKQNIVRVVFY